MALLLIYFQNFFYCRVEPWGYCRQFFGEVFMYCRFGNPEFFCGGADGRVMLDDILAEDNGSVLGIRFWCKLHYSHSNANLWLYYLYAFGNGKMNG